MTKIKNVIGSILLELGNFNKEASDKVFFNKMKIKYALINYYY